MAKCFTDEVLKEANAQELALLDEQRQLKNTIIATAAEIDAMADNDDEEHNAEAASEGPSTSSQKASTSKRKQKMLASLQTIPEKDYESDNEETTT